MTTRSGWKKGESRVARFFGSERTPLSGGNSKITRSDSLHPRLYIETKMRVRHSVVTLWDDTRKKAMKEGKIPVVCLKEKNRGGTWILVHSSDLDKIVEERERGMKETLIIP